MNTKLTGAHIEAFDATYKISLVGTIDDTGEPHVTLMSTLQAKDETTLTLGQFVEGVSKQYMQQRPDIGFLVMGLDKRFWTGSAAWTEKRTHGDEYEKYNEVPLFRYNAYFGVHTVHYFDLKEVSDGEPLSMGAVVFRAVLNMLTRWARKRKVKALKPWALKLLQGVATLKFLCVIADGSPMLVPVVEAQASDAGRIIVPYHPYAHRLPLQKGDKVAMLGANLDMVSVHVNGTFSGWKRGILGRYGIIDIERVYNSVPPKQGWIYPENTANV